MQIVVVSLYIVTGRFLAQVLYNNADRGWAAFIALSSEKGGMVPNFWRGVSCVGPEAYCSLG